MQQNSNKSGDALTLYLCLTALFIAALVTANLIFLKFFRIPIHLHFLQFDFVQSVGLLPYPFTFIITDIISEVFGKKNANRVVLAGFFASIFMLLIVTLALNVPADADSPVNQTTFKNVFGLSAIGVGASMAAYLVAQFVDVRLFHFWKQLTKGKHLWLRNNLSTIFSQIIDTFLVVFILILFGEIAQEKFYPIFIAGVLFKIAFALIDTPIIYAILFFIRKKFNLKFGEEIRF